MLTVGWMDSHIFDGHEPSQGHPESPARLSAIRAQFEASGLTKRLLRSVPRQVDLQLLESVHEARYVRRVEQLAHHGGGYLDEGDTWVGPGTLAAALTAAGAAVGAAERVLSGQWQRAFCSVRPPGHHARRDAGMGFCIFNNVAIGAVAALARSARRVAVVDFDVHHGNGTAELLAEHPGALYASVHQSPFYPHTGAVSRPRHLIAGINVSCPLRAGSGDSEFLEALQGAVMPAVERFAPDLMLLSAGFDADARDPLADLRMTPMGFRELTRRLVKLAERVCAGRIVSVLEGGYDLQALAEDAALHVEALCEPA